MSVKKRILNSNSIVHRHFKVKWLTASPKMYDVTCFSALFLTYKPTITTEDIFVMMMKNLHYIQLRKGMEVKKLAIFPLNCH